MIPKSSVTCFSHVIYFLDSYVMHMWFQLEVLVDQDM